jgi:hypothetical protein
MVSGPLTNRDILYEKIMLQQSRFQTHLKNGNEKKSRLHWFPSMHIFLGSGEHQLDAV